MCDTMSLHITAYDIMLIPNPKSENKKIKRKYKIQNEMKINKFTIFNSNRFLFARAYSIPSLLFS